MEAPAPDFSKVAGAFAGCGPEDRREVLDMLRDISKSLAERVTQEVGEPVHAAARVPKPRAAGAR